jgi:maltose O-acetyltransferase
MTEKEKMLSGELYIAANDPQLQKELLKARKLTRMFNQTTEEQRSYREEILKELFEKTGKKIYIEPPFYCDYGCNISIGQDFYANFDCVILDVCKVKIGNNVFFGPKVCVCTATHPIDASIRNELLEYGKPINIGDSVWIGANAVINPGVNIGNNVIIGSGSVVTKNIPANVIAAGNPCKILREITQEDETYWKKKREQYYDSEL